MEIDEQEPEPRGMLSDGAYAILGEKDSLLLSSEMFLRKRLIRWVVRTMIGTILFMFLAWKYEWGRWLLFTWIPLAILSLLTIILGMRRVRKKGDEIEAVVQSMRGR